MERISRAGVRAAGQEVEELQIAGINGNGFDAASRTTDNRRLPYEEHRGQQPFAGSLTIADWGAALVACPLPSQDSVAHRG